MARQNPVARPVAFDALLTRDPEPCDTCRTRLMLFISYDGVRRCRPCVRIYADERGWNELVLAPAKRKKKHRGPIEGQQRLLADE